ncbi:MAG: iron-sulfur cluster assembly accessory protein [Gammaproteobacteria bacterium]|nr:iron-sulfur cluster assembly accessory protein [Gammaproteobacteria bacterium]
MFKVSKAAGKELKRSMTEQDILDMPLRIAAKRIEDGSIVYQMGFDDPDPGDTMVASSGIDVIIAKEHLVLLNGTELDYVLMDDGDQHFIFLNPNDEHYVPPKEDEEVSGSRDEKN